MTVATVGIRELKTHLSKYIRQVKKGSVVLITDRGEPVGQIMPFREKTTEEKVMVLRDAGFLLWNGEKLALDPVEPIEKLREDVLISDLMLEDRD